jgi:ABC-type sulfate transport system substrate-binding protein
MGTHSVPAASQQSALPRRAQPEPVLNWTKLARRDDLELVHRDGRTLASGRVDMLALDGSVFWLIQDNGKGRAMFLPDSEVIVFRHRRSRKVHSS